MLIRKLANLGCGAIGYAIQSSYEVSKDRLTQISRAVESVVFSNGGWKDNEDIFLSDKVLGIKKGKEKIRGFAIFFPENITSEKRDEIQKKFWECIKDVNQG